MKAYILPLFLSFSLFSMEEEPVEKPSNQRRAPTSITMQQNVSKEDGCTQCMNCCEACCVECIKACDACDDNNDDTKSGGGMALGNLNL